MQHETFLAKFIKSVSDMTCFNYAIMIVIQGASLELSPPLLHSYIVKGVTVSVTHPVKCLISQ